MCHLDRHPLTPCSLGFNVCPASRDPAPVVLSVLPTQSGSVHASNNGPHGQRRLCPQPFWANPGTTRSGITERFPGQEFAAQSTWHTSWSLSAFGSHRVGTMPFSCKLRGRKVGSWESTAKLACYAASAVRGAWQTGEFGASGDTWPRNQLCNVIMSAWAQQVLLMGPNRGGLE